MKWHSKNASTQLHHDRYLCILIAEQTIWWTWWKNIETSACLWTRLGNFFSLKCYSGFEQHARNQSANMT